jgi:hypothetical protein
MKKPSLINPATSLAMGVCLLALSAGVAFATDLHPMIQTTPGAMSNGTGQTGSNVLSSCSIGGITTLGTGSFPGRSGSADNPAGTNGSPFNQSVAKTYAGNCGSPTGPSTPTATCPVAGQSSANRNTAVSQYDIACAQQSIH